MEPEARRRCRAEYHASHSTLITHILMQASAASGNTYHVLQYKFVPDMETKRAPVRQAHLDYLKNLVSGLQIGQLLAC